MEDFLKQWIKYFNDKAEYHNRKANQWLIAIFAMFALIIIMLLSCL